MTYKTRLIVYVGMLIILLAGMMTLSFKTARDVIMAGTQEHLRHGALLKQDSVRAQREELLHYTEIIGSDLRLQEYLFIIVELGTSPEGLEAYYNRQFGVLPTDFRLILSGEGEVLLEPEYPSLVEKARQHLESGEYGHFYTMSPDGMLMVAMGPVIYQGQQLATAFVARALDEAWLATQERRSGDHLLFFEQNGELLWSSNPDFTGAPVDVPTKSLRWRDESFRLHEVSIYDGGVQLPRLWFAISETRLILLLERYQSWVYLFAVLGSLAVLLVGWLMMRNFDRPFSQLMLTTEQMIEGKLPIMSRSESNTEMDKLVNRFADVLDALRHEQAELKRAHKKLQETAITDSLTGLYNRRYLQEVTPGLFAQVVRDQRYLTAVLMDLDYFKAINDCHGHLGGDAVLVHFARLLQHNSRANDHLFRIGGEEFLILNVAEDPQSSIVLANKIRELVSQSPANYQGTEIPTTVSIGISCCYGRSGESSLSRLMRAADKALYEAKSSGRNQVVSHASCRDAVASISGRPNISLVRVNPASPLER